MKKGINEILPYNARFEEVKRILIESADIEIWSSNQQERGGDNSVDMENFLQVIDQVIHP
jgi:hypothetical protein